MHSNVRKVVTGAVVLAATAAFSVGVSSEAWGAKGSSWDGSKGSSWDGAKGSSWDSHGSSWDSHGSSWDSHGSSWD